MDSKVWIKSIVKEVLEKDWDLFSPVLRDNLPKKVSTVLLLICTIIMFNYKHINR